MKYGDTLRQRSITEWAHYNIDYDYLKDLIKHQTTTGTAKALSIPGQGETIERAFGDSFFQVLRDQHNRINTFVKSKSGEIESRLEYIGKRLAQLQARHPNITAGAQLPAKLVEQYAKIDSDVSKAGEEIRSLSRFSTVQRTGFKKILKKYKRWTKDSELGQRFRSEISESPDSLFRLDLGYLLDQYIDVLGAVRAPLDLAGASSSQLAPKHSSSSASKLSASILDGTDLDFDIAVSTVPLGQQGDNATYWVHEDHVVEVQVLLLQHMRLYAGVGNRVDTSKDSPHTAPGSRKSSTTNFTHFSNEDDAGLIVLDDIQSYVRKQNASTVASSENASDRSLANASGQVRWNGVGDAVVALQPMEGFDNPSAVKLKRKFVEAFLDINHSPETGWNKGSSEQESDNQTDQNAVTIRSWLAKHTEIQPVAGVCSKRCRFTGLHNSPEGGIWASLDTHIFMKQSLQKHLKDNDWVHEARTGSYEFAHAVLEIRREGNHSAALIQHLDRSHLAQRVHGYSLEAHAVWTCCKARITTPPLWASLLDQDIRGLPAPVRRRRRRGASITESQSFTSPSHTSPSAGTSFTDVPASPLASRHEDTPITSASELVEPPSLQAFKKKRRRPYAEYPPPLEAQAGQTQRYWNEYDNPESEDDAYYIYIDPNAPVGFPGQEFLESCMNKVKKLFRVSATTGTGEQSPLLATPDYVSSDDDSGDEGRAGNYRSYGAINATPGRLSREGFFDSILRTLHLQQNGWRTAPERPSLIAQINDGHRQREMAKLQTYVSCLAAGSVVDMILAIMATTSRKKLRGEVDDVVIFGVVFNFMLLLVATVSMHTRHDRLGWVHQGFVYAIVIGLVVADIILFKWALGFS